MYFRILKTVINRWYKSNVVLFQDIFQNVIYVRKFSHQLCCITINITLSNKKSKVTFFLEDPVPLWLYNIESYKPCTDQILICWFKYQHQWAIPASTVTNTTKAGQYTPVLMPITILMGNTCRSIVTDTTKDEQYTPLLILKLLRMGNTRKYQYN